VCAVGNAASPDENVCYMNDSKVRVNE
jgi:hypothetical protein